MKAPTYLVLAVMVVGACGVKANAEPPKAGFNIKSEQVSMDADSSEQIVEILKRVGLPVANVRPNTRPKVRTADRIICADKVYFVEAKGGITHALDISCQLHVDDQMMTMSRADSQKLLQLFVSRKANLTEDLGTKQALDISDLNCQSENFLVEKSGVITHRLISSCQFTAQ